MQPGAETDSRRGQGEPSASNARHALTGRRVAILFKRNVSPDDELVRFLEQALASEGVHLFLDKHRSIGMGWARELELGIRTAEFVLPLLSSASVHNEMFAFEVEIAHEAAMRQKQFPCLLPIRVSYDQPLPESLSGLLSDVPHLSWQGPQDNERLLTALLEAIPSAARGAGPEMPAGSLRVVPESVLRQRSAPPARHRADRETVEPVGGALPLDSEYYVPRAADREFKSAIQRGDSVILVKGARQIGKTSLLARVLHQARLRQAKVVHLDLQKLNASHFANADRLYLAMAEIISEELNLGISPHRGWDARRGPNVNFERFLRREVLDKLTGPMVIGLDEVDRLFHVSFGTEVFALFRSWHNERALEPSGPWMYLTLAIAYATEAHLFIRDLNQSPFNVGTRLMLEDFTREQIAELNERYDSPLKNAAEIAQFHRLVNGQPYLVSRGLYEMRTRRMRLEQLDEQADRDDGIYGDHLRRMLVMLAKDPTLCEAVREVLASRACPTAESFYRLRSSGILTGTSERDVYPRCHIYATYLARHLL